MPRSITNNRQKSSISAAERAFADGAKRSTIGSAVAPRRPAIVRVPDASERLSGSAADMLDGATRKLRAAPKTTMRFLQFVRAYIRGFAAAAGAFLLLSEFASGHFNIVAALGTHLFMIIAAPFFALIIAPAIFTLYDLTAFLPVRHEHRPYALSGGLGLVLVVPTLMRAISTPTASAFSALSSGIIMFVSALFGAWIFSRAAAKLRENQA